MPRSNQNANGPAPLGRPINPEARARRREQILAGAKICFLRKGFHAATTAEISAAAGVSVANLYQYFPAKDDLVKALIEDDLAEDLALVAMVGKARNVREGLEGIAGLLSVPDLAEHSRLRLEIVAEAARNPAIAAVVKESDARVIEALTELLSRLQDAGELRRDESATQMAEMILSLYEGLYGRLAFGSGDPPTLLRAANKMFIDAFTPQAG